jgi:hypothetical protein
VSSFIYNGVRVNGETEVTKFVGSEFHGPLDPRLDIRNHSPTGFEWGYGGSGPAQLALAILCDFFADPELARELYMKFKFDVIAGLRNDQWQLTGEQIQAWVDRQEQPAPE